MPFGPGFLPSVAQSLMVTAPLCQIIEGCSTSSVGKVGECGGLSAVGEEGTGRAPRMGGTGPGRLCRQVAMSQMRVKAAKRDTGTAELDRVPNCR